jgi:hypothetical protein
MLETLSKKFSSATTAEEKMPPEISGEEKFSSEPPEPVVVVKALLTHCRPWCDRCGGWQGIEITWSDGQVELKCRSCRADLPERPTGEWKPNTARKGLTVGR